MAHSPFTLVPRRNNTALPRHSHLFPTLPKRHGGHKAFSGYLQGGIDEGKENYDATEMIVKTKEPVHILIDYVRFFEKCKK